MAHIDTASLSYDPATPLEIIVGTIAINSADRRPTSILFVVYFASLYVEMH